jgi:hypothetical protein
LAGDVPQARPGTGSSSSSESGSESGEGSSSEDSGAEAAAANPAAVSELNQFLLDAEAAAVDAKAAAELASQEAEIRRLEMLAAAQKMVAEETARLAAVEEAKVQEQREAAEVEVRRLAEQKEADDKLKAAAFLLALQNTKKRKDPAEKKDKRSKKAKKAENVASSSSSHSLLDSAKVPQNVQPVDDDDEQELTHERTGREDYKRYSLSPGPVRVLAEFVVDCPPGMNQRPRDDEFCRVLIHSLSEKGVSMFSQPLALMLNEAMVSLSYNDMLLLFFYLLLLQSAAQLQGVADGPSSASGWLVDCRQ